MKEINISNVLTLLRLAAGPAILVLLITTDKVYLPLILFILGVFSDFLDGFIARKLNLITQFGKLVDPIADKVLYGCVLFGILIKNNLTLWIWIASFAVILYIAGYILFVKKELKISFFGRVIISLNALIIIIMLMGYVNNYLLILLSLCMLFPPIDYARRMIKHD